MLNLFASCCVSKTTLTKSSYWFVCNFYMIDTKDNMAKKMRVIGKTRVPIIRFVKKRSGISFDISFDIENGPN